MFTSIVIAELSVMSASSMIVTFDPELDTIAALSSSSFDTEYLSFDTQDSGRMARNNRLIKDAIRDSIASLD